METSQYSAPVSTLLTYGSARDVHDWTQYLTLGFSQEHVPELITMLTDNDLQYAESTSDEVWAPLHAWRILGQLRAVEAIPALLDQLSRIDEDGDDWVGEEFPEVFAMIGPLAISALCTYLSNSQHLLFARICAGHSLSKVGNAHPDARQDCIRGLETQLRQHRHNDPTLNGFLVSFLLELKAVEALSTIQAAYRDTYVDLSITGDCEDAEIELGVRKMRTTPRPRFGLLGLPEESQHLPPARHNNKKKIGRNDPCPCGSGKKYKKCCLNK
jgi:hypothetical protein